MQYFYNNITGGGKCVVREFIHDYFAKYILLCRLKTAIELVKF